MTRLTDLELMVRIAELGSLTAAARALDWSPAAASAAIRRLEERLGAALFVRSTRSLRLSAEGERFLPHARRALESIDAGLGAIAQADRGVAGALHLSMPSDLGRHLLLPWLDAFKQRHPDVALRLQLSDSPVDMRRSPIDLAIRYDPAPDAAVVALPLAPKARRVLVASPDYIARHGLPDSADALRRHPALRFLLSDELPRSWRLRIDGRWQDVAVEGDRVANDGEVVRRWAQAGHGIAYKSWWDVAGDVAAGRLVQVNPHWIGEAIALTLVAPGRQQLTPVARALHAWLARHFGDLAVRMPAALQVDD